MGLTSNYWNAVKAWIENKGIANGITTVDGTTAYCGFFAANSSTSIMNRQWYAMTLKDQGITFSTSAGWAVGTGDAAESASDYKLDEQITSGMTATTTISNGVISIILTNSGSSAVTVKEVGYQYVIATQDGSSSNYTVALLLRKVLDTPITIAAGDTGVIKVAINFTIPS